MTDTDLIAEIASDICNVDNSYRLSADGLATLVTRRLYDKNVIRLDQVRKVGAFVAANANMDPRPLATQLVTHFELGCRDESAGSICPVHHVQRRFGACPECGGE